MKTKNDKRISAIERMKSTINRNQFKITELLRLIGTTDKRKATEPVEILRDYDSEVNRYRQQSIETLTRKNQQHARVIENTQNNISMGVR